MKEFLRKNSLSTYRELSRLYTNLSKSQAHISDGGLIRILTDVGYASVSVYNGYLSISYPCSIERIRQDQKEAEEYEEYLQTQMDQNQNLNEEHGD